MGTTISLDDQLDKKVRQAAEARGISRIPFISRTLHDALKRREPSEQPSFTLLTVRGMHPHPGVDLDQPRALDAMDNETRLRLGRL